MVASEEQGMSPHQELVKEADSWVKAIVLNRQSGLCLRGAYDRMMRCGGPLQGAHILRKGALYSAIRHDLDNVVVLCRNHHIFWGHKDEHAFYEWIEQIYPGRIARLKETAMAPHRKIDLKELICVLKSIHDAELKAEPIAVSLSLRYFARRLAYRHRPCSK